MEKVLNFLAGALNFLAGAWILFITLMYFRQYLPGL